MRIAITLISILFILSCTTTPYEETQPVPESYVKIIEISKSKDELFNNSMMWMTKSFNSAKAVVQFTDKEVGIINGKANSVVQLNGIMPANLEYIITIEIKDGKVRISFSNINSIFIYQGNRSASPLWYQGWEPFTKWADNVILDYTNYINNNNDNW